MGADLSALFASALCALGTALSIDERRTKKAKATAAQLPPKVAAERDSEFSHTPSGELVTNKEEALKRFLRRKQVTAASDASVTP